MLKFDSRFNSQVTKIIQFIRYISYNFNSLLYTSGAANAQYDSGTAFTVGAGLSLGPYTYNYSACSVACSNWAYQGQDCRAFAHRYTLSLGNICYQDSRV